MSKPDGSYNKAGGRKRGRNELRTIRRSSKRKEIDENLENNEAVEDHGSESKLDDKVDNDDDTEAAQEMDEEEKKGKVYDALLTILKTEHPELKKKSTKKQKLAKEKSNFDSITENKNNEEDEEEDEEALIDNGLDRNADDEDKDDQENDDAESDDEKDEFEMHFNQYPAELIDSLDAAYKNGETTSKSVKQSVGDDESSIFSRTIPQIMVDEEKIDTISKKMSLQSYFIKKRLQIQNDLLDDTKSNLTDIQKQLVDPMFQYKDILYEYGSYGKDEDEYRELYCLHVLNHIYKTRDRILKDNQKIQNDNDAEYLDQGFTRPKVLIVVPTRDTGYQVVNKLINKSGIEQVDKKGKFRDQFFEDSLPPSSKPKTFQQIFKGNTNDFFVLGMKFTRKAIKLYSNFYQSDIIVCSPLGLQMIVENTDKKKRQDDFLSSIEVTIVDQFNVIEFQNVSHLYTIFDHLNTIPKEQHDSDFSRIRMWYINDQAKMFRQTMLFTKYISPNSNSIINHVCKNWSGRWKNHKRVEPSESSVGQLGIRVKQIFQRFNVLGGHISEEPDYRFRHFCSVIVPSITKSTGYEDGILIYIPDYTDYLRVSNYLREKTSILFGEINEYSSQKKLNANRSLFQQGRVKVLLYTERLHHFRRYELKGVKSVLFYQPPTNPEFYTEVVRYIGKSAFLGTTDLNISTVRCLYSKTDGLALERVVGTKRAAVLTRGQNETYEFK
ncbi:similar to Saccharomyces cerevisiae YIL091C UTP25 Nucleolar protein required for 35S pre-RNA processing and 40S ribosomal subunit biogenesis [Maudiozyma barnettii]|uniref:U3 small nucleolar RNA-associated protein 25 n=1 Tax=Maudiozyma barnettii TaxID=61262 RepID=A0A8H2ZJI1_9SACH|nr:rRNA-binding ribosome biosynthesis protein UTP25 [Kazachstania barnettii]CAB4257048.1 similar to Saccharomyces cerevisiae YIL091C UTP25 Nucleolar protein required for 35S pre-RNA processing and 40S ribosomal subunit biogenesis [Kazachstania barnettii]CAD1779419.1 similar to Saccharomyces cerevisiae YIL091C UTP25 Nucleolar protein required for 35S pre-RNA processing and 40S ribosomal subunit biogenesis [Kazachstania barnettii]